MHEPIHTNTFGLNYWSLLHQAGADENFTEWQESDETAEKMVVIIWIPFQGTSTQEEAILPIKACGMNPNLWPYPILLNAEQWARKQYAAFLKSLKRLSRELNLRSPRFRAGALTMTVTHLLQDLTQYFFCNVLPKYEGCIASNEHVYCAVKQRYM